MKIWIIDDEFNFREQAKEQIKKIDKKCKIFESDHFNWPPDFLKIKKMKKQDFPDLVILDLFKEKIFADPKGTYFYFNLREQERKVFGKAVVPVILWSIAYNATEKVENLITRIDDKDHLFTYTEMKSQGELSDYLKEIIKAKDY